MTFFRDSPNPTGSEVRLPGESLFDFCCRSNAPELREGRAIVNRWLQDHPPDGVPELEARLRSARDTDHLSAMHELQLYAMLAAPSLPIRALGHGNTSNPDFQLVLANDEKVNIEATLRLDLGDSTLFDLMQFVTPKVSRHEPRLRVFVNQFAGSPSSPSSNRLASFLLREFASLLNERGPVADSDYTNLGEIRYVDDKSGWTIELDLVAAPVDAKPAPTIAMALGSTSFVSQAVPLLQQKLVEKIAQHRGLPDPLVVAVGWQDFPNKPEEDDILRALCRKPEVLGAKLGALIFTYPNATVWNTSPARSEVWIATTAPESVRAIDWPLQNRIYDPRRARIIVEAST